MWQSCAFIERKRDILRIINTKTLSRFKRFLKKCNPIWQAMLRNKQDEPKRKPWFSYMRWSFQNRLPDLIPDIGNYTERNVLQDESDSSGTTNWD